MDKRDWTAGGGGTPDAGGTLQFTPGSSVSGVLIGPGECYRITTDADVWLEVSSGSDVGPSALGDHSMALWADQKDYLLTTAVDNTLHALGVTTSGLLNYIRMK